MNHWRHDLLSINSWYKLFNLYTLEIIVFSCGWTSITRHDLIVLNQYFVLFQNETLKLHSAMYHGKCTSKFEFSGKWQRGFISFTCWIQVFCSDTIQSVDLLQNILRSLYFNNYFVVIILNSGIMIWIKKYL